MEFCGSCLRKFHVEHTYFRHLRENPKCLHYERDRWVTALGNLKRLLAEHEELPARAPFNSFELVGRAMAVAEYKKDIARYEARLAAFPQQEISQQEDDGEI